MSQYVFVSLLSRDSVYDMLRRICTHLQVWGWGQHGGGLDSVSLPVDSQSKALLDPQGLFGGDVFSLSAHTCPWAHGELVPLPP